MGNGVETQRLLDKTGWVALLRVTDRGGGVGI